MIKDIRNCQLVAFVFSFSMAVAWIVPIYVGFNILNRVDLQYAIANVLVAATAWSGILAAVGFHYSRQASAPADLFHFTSSWDEIKQSQRIYPTADGRIYFSVSGVDLGSISGKVRTKLVMPGAQRKIAWPLRGHPWSWSRFKQLRGEWVSSRAHLLVFDGYAISSDSSVSITSASLEKIEGSLARSMIWIRALVACVLLFVPGWFVVLALVPIEMTRNLPFQAAKVDNFDLLLSTWSFRVVEIWAALIVAGFLLQDRFNRWVFQKIR